MIHRIIAIAVNPKERNEIQRKSVGNTRNRNCQTHRRETMILPITLTIDESDTKRRSIWKNDPIKLYARLTAKLLKTAYKSKIIKLKLDDYPIQRRIYSLTFVE